MIIKDLGIVEYSDTFNAMKSFTNNRTSQTGDEIWLVEHPSIFTLGQAGKESYLINNKDNISLFHADRGGQITYHGLGQIVVYTLLNLHRLNIYVRDLVNKLEQSIIDTLIQYNLVGVRLEGAPGIYIAKNSKSNNIHNTMQNFYKIAALGLKISKGCSYHGLALNVSMDLMPFSYISPCGYEELQVIDMQSMLKIDIDKQQVKKFLVENLLKILYN